jgi:ribosomal-protein-alanine N-acetyltransferase
MSDNTITEETFIDFICPHCGKEVSFPESCAGLVRECFDCRTPLIVPVSGGQATPIPLPVKSPRLVLRRFDGPDWRDLLELATQTDFVGAAVFGDTEDSVTRWLEADTAVKLTTPGAYFTLAVDDPAKGKVIGFVTLRFDSEMLQADLSLAVRPDVQRNGFGLETAKAVLDFCFDRLSLHRVQASCESTQTAACALFNKIGLRREGEFIQDHKSANGQWANTTNYAILGEEWTATATP